jgi:ATP-dependent Clp protease ATP-binding subunit ClpA
VKRVIQREVQDRLADFILAGEARPEQTVVLDVVDDGFVLRSQAVEAGRA